MNRFTGLSYRSGAENADAASLRPSRREPCLTNYASRLTGFDASAHLSEKTKNASWSAPIGVVSSVGFSALFGFFVLMAFLFSIQDFDNTIASPFGQPVRQIFVDVFGEDGALVLLSLIMSEQI